MRADVLIIEDEAEIAKLISDYLKKEGIDSVCVETGEDGLDVIEKRKFDLIVLDINLPGIDGYEVLQKIRERHNTSVLIVSARVDDADIILGYGMGADDFISKPFSPRVLSAKIRTHINRLKNRLDSKGDFFFGDYVLDISSYCLKKDGVRVKLRPKELDIIIYLAKNRGRIVSGEELYNAVWNSGEVDLSTIAVHMRRIRDKIEKDSASPEFLKTVYGKGYFLAI